MHAHARMPVPSQASHAVTALKGSRPVGLPAAHATRSAALSSIPPAAASPGGSQTCRPPPARRGSPAAAPGPAAGGRCRMQPARPAPRPGCVLHGCMGSRQRLRADIPAWSAAPGGLKARRFALPGHVRQQGAHRRETGRHRQAASAPPACEQQAPRLRVCGENGAQRVHDLRAQACQRGLLGPQRPTNALTLAQPLAAACQVASLMGVLLGRGHTARPCRAGKEARRQPNPQPGAPSRRPPAPRGPGCAPEG